MANPEHLNSLRKGVESWNRWRAENPNEQPNLGNANLASMDLSYAHLNRANLSTAVLSGARLVGADLSEANLSFSQLDGADLKKATLSHADLSGVNLSGARLSEARVMSAKLVGATLSGAILDAARFDGARLANTDFSHAKLRFASLVNTSLPNAKLISADLQGANFTGADLTGADLTGSDFNGTKLRNANFTSAIFHGTVLHRAWVGYTVFTCNDLSEAVGLETINHAAPSSIGVDTLYKSQGKIPEQFLRDAGVPEEVIDVAHSLRTGPPIQWHSCFISYSTQDDEFARRLHSRMRQANMRVWFAPEEMQGGKKLHEQIFEAIQLYDKLLLVLSPRSLQSDWVMTEIRKAREVEKKEERRKLFPIRLVDFDTLRGWACFDADSGKDLAVVVREYFIPDFSNWKDNGAFEAAFARLQKDLQAEEQRTGS